MFGGDKYSSSSKNDDIDTGAASASVSDEAVSKEHTQSTKAFRLEESEAKSKERASPERPQDLVPCSVPSHIEYAEMVDAAQGIMFLGKCC